MKHPTRRRAVTTIEFEPERGYPGRMPALLDLVIEGTTEEARVMAATLANELDRIRPQPLPVIQF